MNFATRVLVTFVTFCAIVPEETIGSRRCISCRSRGELGSCKDPFTLTPMQVEKEKGIDIVPCASGWCGKIIESQSLNNEYGTATQRMCFQKGPDDGEERCAYTVWKYRKVYMCFCSGDLCNSAPVASVPNGLIAVAIIYVTIRFIL